MAAAVDSFISSAEVPDIISLTTKLSERLSELAGGGSALSSPRGSLFGAQITGFGAGPNNSIIPMARGLGAGGRPRSGAVNEGNANMSAALAASSGGSGAAAGATKGLTLTPTPAQIARNIARASKPNRSPPILYRRNPKKLNIMEPIPNALEEEESENGDLSAPSSRGAGSGGSGSTAAAASSGDAGAAAARGATIAKLPAGLPQPPPPPPTPEGVTLIRSPPPRPPPPGWKGTYLASRNKPPGQGGGARRRTAHQKHNRLARRLTQRRR